MIVPPAERRCKAKRRRCVPTNGDITNGDYTGPAAGVVIRRMTTEPTLSPREREILNCMRRDLSHKEMAAELDISIFTVREYIKRIKLKTGEKPRLLAIIYPQIAKIFTTEEGTGFHVPITFIPARRAAA
jgi:DNA-binding CsgD family transcriptional regulator